MATSIGRTAVRDLTDASVGRDFVEALSDAALDEEGVLKVQRARARQMGRYAIADLVVEVESTQSFAHVSEVVSRVRRRILVRQYIPVRRPASAPGVVW
eukprot:scaffold620_cov386-Prasinococcus_capsulatus_cf.AAC.17